MRSPWSRTSGLGMSVLLQPKRKDNKYSAYNHGIRTDSPDQREKRIRGSKNFRSPPQKDFCNNICQKRTVGPLFEKRKSLQPFRIGARSQMFGAPSQDLLASVH